MNLAEAAAAARAMATRAEASLALEACEEAAKDYLAILRFVTPKRSGALADSEHIDAVFGGGARATAVVADPMLASTLKVFVLDEAWRFLRDQAIRAYITEAFKTWRKKNACVLLATQSSEDLQRSELRVAIESCPTTCFLANPQIDRAVYQDVFHLNEVEADCIATLVPRQQILLKQPGVAKVLNLHVDAQSAALFSVARQAVAV